MLIRQTWVLIHQTLVLNRILDQQILVLINKTLASADTSSPEAPLRKARTADCLLGGDGVGGDIAPLAASRRCLPCAAGCLAVFWVSIHQTLGILIHQRDLSSYTVSLKLTKYIITLHTHVAYMSNINTNARIHVVRIIVLCWS